MISSIAGHPILQEESALKFALNGSRVVWGALPGIVAVHAVDADAPGNPVQPKFRRIDEVYLN